MNENEIKRADQRLSYLGYTGAREGLLSINKHYEDSKGKLILVMSHSATLDLQLGILLFGKSSLPITALISCQQKFNWLWNRLGLIAKVRGKDNNSQQVTERLKKKQRFCLLIGLARTAPAQRIHSGYFYMARETGARIVVIGFDYLTKTCYVSAKYWQPEAAGSYVSFQESGEERSIVEELNHIFPLQPSHQVGFSKERYITYFPDRAELVSVAEHVLSKVKRERRQPHRSIARLYTVEIVILMLLCLFILGVLCSPIVFIMLRRHRNKS